MVINYKGISPSGGIPFLFGNKMDYIGTTEPK